MANQDPISEAAPPTEDAKPQVKEGMWLSDLSINQPVFITMVMLAVCVIGLIAYSRMPVDLFPDISFPVVSVSTAYPGASPEEVERTVTKPIEDAVASLSMVESISSTSADSQSVVTIQFDLDKDSKLAADEVRARLDLIRNSFPTDVQDPVVVEFDPDSLPILAIAFADRTGTMGPEELRELVEDTLQPRLERAPGVASITITGGRKREIHVDLNATRLQAYGVTSSQVVGAIQSANRAVPAGRIVENGREESLRTAGELRSLDEIAAIPIQVAGVTNGTIRVGDLGTVTFGAAEARTLSRLDGEDSVTATVRKQSGANTVAAADAVKEELARIEREFPNLNIVIASDQSTFVRESVEDVQMTLIIGAILASVIVLFFFRDFRNTIITVSGLPVIMLGTYATMDALGLGLNMITTLALSLSIGLLIDDAIVVRENILRRVELGESPRTASRRGTAEIALAVVAVSSTIVAVFLPIAFTGGIVGRFLASFGITVSVAVIISLIEAFTLAPMLSAYFFKRSEAPTSDAKFSTHDEVAAARGRLNTTYARLLELALRRRWLVVAGSVVIFLASLTLFVWIPITFVAETDEGVFSISITMPAGTVLAETDRVATAVEDVLRSHEEVAHVFTTVGSGTDVETATIRVELKERGHTLQVMERWRSELEQAAGPRAQLQTVMLSSSTGGGGSGVESLPIQLVVRGQDSEDVQAVARDVVERVKTIPGAADVDWTEKPGKAGRDIVVDRLRAADLGISPTQLGLMIRTLVNGETAASLRSGDETTDIVVRLREEDRRTPDQILSLPVPTGNGSLVPLGTVARLQQIEQPTQILRSDRQRQIRIGLNALGRSQPEVSADVQRLIAEVQSTAPAGVTVAASGSIEDANEAFGSMLLALGLSIMFLYMILASQFGSFVHPFTIMLALPFSIVGALLGLFVSGKPMDLMAMIGILLLMGLVTKNSILLVDFANQRLRKGFSAREAMLAAGQIRLRPILMTTLAMLFGMVPVATAFGSSSELRQGMGYAVIGGLIVSTVLTLFVVPVAYTLVDDLTGWVKRRFRQRAERAEQRALARRKRAAGDGLRGEEPVPVPVPVDED